MSTNVMKKTKISYAGQWLRDWYGIFIHELRLIFSDAGAMVVFFVGGLLYPVLYNLVYYNGSVDEIPVAVVDLSDGACSRRFVQEFDATRECEVYCKCVSMAEAEQLLRERKVHGILYIPRDFDSCLARMEQGHISTYADMSSFLYYKNLRTASSLVMLDEVHKIQLEHYAEAGFDGQSASTLVQPLVTEENIPYNRPFSYTIFFISAALMLVIQQTMFYGSSMLAGTLRERNHSFASLPDRLQGLGMGRVVLGRGAAYLAIYLVIGTIVTLLIPYLFRLPQHAAWWEILVLLGFFVVDCIFFSFTWGTLITRRETVFVLFLSVSPICLFLTGFSWPETAIPGFWRAVSYIFPSTFGCRAFINLNTAGGTLQTIAPEIRALTVQTVIYYFLACAAVFAENRMHKQIAHRREPQPSES